MPTRNYSSIAQPTSITADITAGATTLDVGSNAGYPAPPFVAAINHTQPGKAEAVLVTAVSGLTWTVTRGVDGTTARAHTAGASVVHTAIGLDYREAQQRLDALEAGPYKINVPTGMPPNTHGQVVDRATRNLIPNPSFEVNLAGWTPGSSTAAAVPGFTRDSGGQIGSFVGNMAFPTGATDAYIDTDRLTVTGSTEYILSSWIWASREFASTQLRIFAFFYDSAGAFITSVNKIVEYYPRRGARRHSVGFTTPAGAVTCMVRLFKDNVDLGAGNVYSDNWQLEIRGPIGGVPSSYCDGSLGPGYSWEGTPHASPSRRAAGTHVSSDRSRMIVTELEARYLSTPRLYLTENSDGAEYGAKRGVIHIDDTREKNFSPGHMPSTGVRWDFVDNNVLGVPGGGYSAVETIQPWADDSGGGPHQVAYSQTGNGVTAGLLWHRYGTRGGGWGPWRPLQHGDSGYTAMTLANGWVNYGGGYSAAGYMKDSTGFVVCKGLVMNGTANHVATLPVGYRPPERVMITTSSNNAWGRVDVRTDGVIEAVNYNAAWLSLEMIRFRPA